MPVFNVISPMRAAMFVLIATASIGALIVTGMILCTLAGVNHLIGTILGMELGMALLIWTYEIADKKLVSPKWYSIRKLK